MLRIAKAFILLLFSLGVQANAQENNPYVDFRVKTYAIQEQYLENLAAHQSAVMKDLEGKLQQQRWQTTVVSVMIVVMVLLGLVLSALQFYSDFRNRGRSSVTIKAGGGSIEISSTVIGLAILALSFWFFQTYVERVYSIKVFEMQPIDTTTFGINR